MSPGPATQKWSRLAATPVAQAVDNAERMNRLAHSTSPYPLRHEDSPVDWQGLAPAAAYFTKRWTKARAVPATSRHPLSMVSA